VGFHWEAANVNGLKGNATLLVGPRGVVAVLDFYNYVMVLDHETMLIWNQKTGSDFETRPVRVTMIRPKLLPPFGDELESSIQRMAASGARLALTDAPSASMSLSTAEIVTDAPAAFPFAFKTIDEILILCDSPTPNPGPNLALLVARPKESRYSLYPQDWFNSSNLDFGYQWVTRVVRNAETGRVHGEGFRIEPFVLDETLRQLATGKPSA
jgi:hypothetical protein